MANESQFLWRSLDTVDVAVQKHVYEHDEAEILARTMETLKEALNLHS